MQDEGRLGDDAVYALLLHAGQTVEQLVGHVLAKAVMTHVAAFQAHHTAHAAGEILHFKDGSLTGHDLMPRVIHALYADDLARRRDHAPREQIVDGGAVLEAEGAAGILSHVAAYGGGRLGGRIHSEEKALGRGEIYGILRNDTSLAGHGSGFNIDRLGRKTRGAHHHGALAGRHCSTGKTGSTAAGDDREFQFVGEAHEGAHLLRGVGLDDKKRELHAQVGSVGGRCHKGSTATHDALAGHDGGKTRLQLLAEDELCLVGTPEHGDAFTYGRSVLMRQRLGFALIALVHALPHRRGGNEGVVGHEEKLFGKFDGKLTHTLRPAFELIEIDAQDTVDHILCRNGNMRPFVGHGSLLEKRRERKTGRLPPGVPFIRLENLFDVGFQAARDIVLHP